MKNLILTAAVAALGVAGMNTDASARDRGRGVAVRIGGDSFGIRISTGRHGFDRDYDRFRPSRPVIVRPHRHHYHVTWHLHGTRRIHRHNHAAAHSYVRYLESLGFDARVIHNGGHYDVVYHMHGSRSRTFRSHAAAHAFKRQLDRLGADSRVVHH